MSTNVEGRGILEYNPLHHIHHSSMYNKTVCSAQLLSSLINVSELACDWKAREGGGERREGGEERGGKGRGERREGGEERGGKGRGERREGGKGLRGGEE